MSYKACRDFVLKNHVFRIRIKLISPVLGKIWETVFTCLTSFEASSQSSLLLVSIFSISEKKFLLIPLISSEQSLFSAAKLIKYSKPKRCRNMFSPRLHAQMHFKLKERGIFPSISVFIRDFPDFAVRNYETKGNFLNYFANSYYRSQTPVGKGFFSARFTDRWFQSAVQKF